MVFTRHYHSVPCIHVQFGHWTHRHVFLNLICVRLCRFQSKFSAREFCSQVTKRNLARSQGNRHYLPPGVVFVLMDVGVDDVVGIVKFGSGNLRLVHIQWLLLRLRKRWLAISLNYGLQSHFCDCDDLRYRNVNIPKEMLTTHISDVAITIAIAFAIAVCERALRKLAWSFIRRSSIVCSTSSTNLNSSVAM